MRRSPLVLVVFTLISAGAASLALRAQARAALDPASSPR